MKLNSVLLEGVVIGIEVTKRKAWLKVDSDGVVVTAYANNPMRRLIQDKIHEGMEVRLLGRLKSCFRVEMNHLEYHADKKTEVIQ